MLLAVFNLSPNHSQMQSSGDGAGDIALSTLSGPLPSSGQHFQPIQCLVPDQYQGVRDLRKEFSFTDSL